MADRTLLSDPGHERADCRLLGRAAREGWDVTPAERAALKAEALRLAAKREVTVPGGEAGPVTVDNDRNQIAAIKAVVAMTGQDQADAHHADKQEVDETRLKIDAAEMIANLPDAELVRIARTINRVDLLPPRLRELAEREP